MKLYEDLLDDIELEDESSDVVSRLANSDDRDHYDYFMIIRRSSYSQINDNEDEIANYYDKILKQQLDVYVDNYYMSIFRFGDKDNEDAQKTRSLFSIGDEEEIWCNVYFNLDSNLMHILNFYDSIYSCCADGLCSIYDNHTMESIEIFLNHHKMPAYFFKRKQYMNSGSLYVIIEKLATSFLIFFWTYKPILKLQDFNDDKERKCYLEKQIEKFVKNKYKRNNRCRKKK